MNLAAILPSFPQVGFQWRRAARRGHSAALAPSERRTMSRNAIMMLENRPLQLRVVRGWIWITRDGRPEDTVLGAGEVFHQRPGTRVLVQALEETELLFADGAPRIPQNA